MNIEIKRDAYLKKMIDKQNNGLVKIITGIRRCGKSYLLNTIFYNYLIETNIYQDNIIKFAFDSAEDLKLIGEDIVEIEKEKRKVDPKKFISYLDKKIKKGEHYYLLLDEIQLLDCFESVLNGYLHNDNMDIYVTGSNAKFLSKDIITEFSGRGDEIHLQPLNFSEFMSVYKGDKYEGLNEYMLYGGIPLVVLNDDVSEKSSILNRLFNEIYLTDIKRRYKIKGLSEIDELLNILSSSIGSLTNPEKLKNTFKSIKNINISSRTIQKYIGYLEDSFLIESANRYNIKGKYYIGTPKKYYFSDIGLRNARINFRQIERTHIMENLIYNELVMRGFSVDVGVVEIFEKSYKDVYIRKQLEIDFICNMGFKRYYIQSALSLPDNEKIMQESRPFKNIDDSFKKIIITGDMMPAYYNEDGILIINIYDFLLNKHELEK